MSLNIVNSQWCSELCPKYIKKTTTCKGFPCERFHPPICPHFQKDDKCSTKCNLHHLVLSSEVPLEDQLKCEDNCGRWTGAECKCDDFPELKCSRMNPNNGNMSFLIIPHKHRPTHAHLDWTHLAKVQADYDYSASVFINKYKVPSEKIALEWHFHEQDVRDKNEHVHAQLMILDSRHFSRIYDGLQTSQQGWFRRSRSLDKMRYKAVEKLVEERKNDQKRTMHDLRAVLVSYVRHPRCMALVFSIGAEEKFNYATFTQRTWVCSEKCTGRPAPRRMPVDAQAGAGGDPKSGSWRATGGVSRQRIGL